MCIVARFLSIYAILCYAPSPIFSGNRHDHTMQNSTTTVQLATIAKFRGLYLLYSGLCFRNHSKSIRIEHQAFEQQILPHSQFQSQPSKNNKRHHQTFQLLVSEYNKHLHRSIAGDQEQLDWECEDTLLSNELFQLTIFNPLICTH